ADHRVHAAAAAPPPRKGDVERLLRQASGKLLLGEPGAPRLERGFDFLLCGVELRAELFAFFLRKGLERPLKGGQLTRFAEEARLGVLERRGIARRAERGERARDDALEVQSCPPAQGPSGRGSL